MDSFTFLDKIINESFIREPYIKKSWWATDLYSCLRGAFYRRKGLPPTSIIPPDRMGIMEVGKIVEEWIVNKVKESGNLIAEQLRIEAPEYEASGKVDLILDEGGRPILYEIKSTNSFSFRYKLKNKVPQLQHKFQILFYLWRLRNYGHQDLPDLNLSSLEGRLIYVSRDDLNRLIIPVDYSENAVKPLIEQLEILNISWKNDELPPIPQPVIFNEERGKWMVNWVCSFCAYHELCAGRDWRARAEQEIKERNAAL
ncbi:MAG: Dna2/Cas4 domain-containing protein [Candidatus Azambacteria bacterium]|nr:Dna2/Cas4 domain-containing protein [Candidatus Azambacteria bacterium]